uniref:ABC transmembrane type-1 domain-containing protein n=1 Tax=Haemonchus placei TaxID=6290 RepID=A0A0N4WBX8_HAEPC
LLLIRKLSERIFSVFDFSNHIHGTAQMTFCQGIFHRMKPWGFLWLCLFIGVYGLNTALLALHFVYRYIVVCRSVLCLDNVIPKKVEPNNTTIYWLPTIGMGLNFLMMIVTFALMFFCGFKIYFALEKSSMSKKSKVLQTQLLKAVAIQVPCFDKRILKYIDSLVT